MKYSFAFHQPFKNMKTILAVGQAKTGGRPDIAPGSYLAGSWFRGWQRMRLLDGISNSKDKSLRKLRELKGSLLCCSPWGHKESDMTEWLINNNNNISAGHRGSSRYLGSVRKMPLHRSCTAPAVPPCGWSYSVYRLHGVGRGAKE